MNQLQTGPTGKPILIFPASMPRSLDYLEKCKRDGQAVIGSSSLAYDVSKEKYPAWAYLPYVNDPTFNDALQTLIAERNIGGIYTPNPVVWNYLNKVLKKISLDIRLVNTWPMNDELSGYRTAISRAAYVLDNPLSLASMHTPKPALSKLQIASLFRHGNVIPGMCDDAKINALYEIARNSCSGDVVEIGSAFGKSAFILARLSQCYGIGKVLCIDPWKSDFVIQNDNGGLVDNCIDQYDYDEALRVFEMNLLPYSVNDINYLRMPSSEAAQYYKSQRNVQSESFGNTEYTGRIALLHIDGNHSYEAAQADVEAWCTHVLRGGWIIIDDYIWPYGDGPQRVGDEFLRQHQAKIVVSFVMGSALFIQLSAPLQITE
ncbi:class I SAM-dependent methyltransferase [Herminiimonas arsenitoxidans]|uniref:class I SAM-dependent methyltransferase n=1 Tax=Herminiimonas arsenitoxidans TaxID=1809410 RepID=UPI000970EF3D|nr:class I SAM-dependent methyltransferase [Herminiimonas arsenitoxidans]